MDSISQIALGASIAHLTLGERLGRKALVVGAFLGTLPDLDVLVPYADAVESFTYHRSWSHSLLVLTLISPPLALVLQRLFQRRDVSFKRCLLAVWLVLITHPLLDSLTTYGTQIFWPLMPPPAAIGSVFIIDPLYTAPLIVGIVFALRRSFQRSMKVVTTGLVLSTAYLAWTLVAQYQVRQKLEHTVTERGIESKGMLVAPFPLSIIWRAVVQTEAHYYEGFSSLLDSEDTIQLSEYDNGKVSCAQWLTEWPVQRMDWFTRGVFALSIEDNHLVLSDLRIGIHDSYIFRFDIATRNREQWQLTQSEQLPTRVDIERMRQLALRAIDESAVLATLEADVSNLAVEC